MKDLNGTGNLLGGVLLGAIIGGAMGVLFAPDKGCNTRKKIMSKGDDLTEAMEDKFNDFLHEVKKELEVAKGKANELAGR